MDAAISAGFPSIWPTIERFSIKRQNLWVARRLLTIWHTSTNTVDTLLCNAACKRDEMLEPYDGKLSRTVLRRESGSNSADLVSGDRVNVRYDLHRFRNLRKMGGYCIGEPSDWNHAKQAELRDTVPNPVD